MAKERTEVQDIDRSLYDFRYEEKDSDFYKIKDGLTPQTGKRFLRILRIPLKSSVFQRRKERA